MKQIKSKRAAYTLEYKLEAVRLVQGGQARSVTARILDSEANAGQLGKGGIERQTVRCREQTGER